MLRREGWVGWLALDGSWFQAVFGGVVAGGCGVGGWSSRLWWDPVVRLALGCVQRLGAQLGLLVVWGVVAWWCRHWLSTLV